MAEIYDCVAALKNLLNVEYEFVIARKGCKIIIKLKFEKLHFIHLMGLQYIRDVRALDNKAAVVDGTYFCRSFFPQEKCDYSIGQTKWTLLSKKKILKQTKEEIVLCDRGK